MVAELARAGQARAREAATALRGLPRGAVAAVLLLVLARRDLARLAVGPKVAAAKAQRGLGDRLAVAVAGLRGRV